jgi:adenylate cyclase
MIEGMALRVVLIQSDMQTAQPLARYFTQRGDELWQAWELGQAAALINQVKPNLVLMDLHFASADWVSFLRRLRQASPSTRIIMTNKYPDLQREMLAREQDVKVFLRQPFSARWIEQALKRLDEDTRPARGRRVDDAQAARGRKDAAAKGAPARRVRVPVRVKITLPYLLLVVAFALASATLVSRIVLESVQDRFLNQLIETGKQGANWMVREEDRLLATLRLVANTEGAAEAIDQEDAGALRSLILPLAVNAGEEAVEVLRSDGVSVLSARRPAGGSAQDYLYTRGDSVFWQWPFVRKVAAQTTDPQGDKYAGFARAPWGEMFYVCGPVLRADGSLAGIVLVGKSLNSIVREMHQETLGEATLYDADGQPLASTLFLQGETFPLAGEGLARSRLSAPELAHTRDLTVSTVQYTEILGAWQARGEPQGVLGISLAQAFLVRTSRASQVQIFTLVALGIFLALLVGVSLANLITRPLLRLVQASSQVAQGNLEIKVDATGDDEVAVLAQSFNYMVAGLQEGSVYRDLLGRTVSPEVREQLRQTFNSGNLRLEGQQAVATVLMTDIRGFTPISERADPATVFQWLNEYFAQVVPIVAAHGGVVNKFDGDAMLAFFGILPRILSPKQSATAACQAAVEIVQAVDTLNRLRASRGEPPLVTGVGVHTGVVMAGGLGTSDRLHYTIIGDTVNTAQRIEALTREVLNCTGALISHATYSALSGAQMRFHLTPMGAQTLKGKSEQMVVYQLGLNAPPDRRA